eukprot:SAG11_NODE_18751_length_482_cov_0.947781_1_plen_84_part_10
MNACSNGCGQTQAWECDERMPLPPSTFTVAEAAKAAGYATIHTGKWHLGNFFIDTGINVHSASPPSLHGFGEYASTEASGSSST